MTSRERLLAVLAGEVPDCVPVCPDISNMVPARLTGKPFWDIYVYQDPPLWKAHIDALRHFDLDGGFEIYRFGDLFQDLGPAPETRIVHRNQDGSFVTQDFHPQTQTWDRFVVMHTADNPPATRLLPEKLGLSQTPSKWEPIEGIKQWPTGLGLWKLMRAEMAEQGILGMPSGATTCMISGPEEVYEYHDNPKRFYDRRDRMMEIVERRLQTIRTLDVKPDFLICGGSGSLVWQSPDVFRDLSLPLLKRVTELAAELGIATHVHSCGREAALVRMAAEETSLTVIDPLEEPPMGDCDLGELKTLFGDKLVLKGNLHTVEVMLRGSADDVIVASKKAIDDAAAGGRFILSTADQCGRDTPDQNIKAMVETARTYGKY